MGANDPCYKCKKRKLGCHSTCADYIEWAKVIRDRNRTSFRHKEEERMSNEYQIDRIRKYKKK